MLMVTEYHSGVWKQLGQNPSPAVNKSYRAILLEEKEGSKGCNNLVVTL